MPDALEARTRIKRLITCGGLSLMRAEAAVDVIPPRLLGYYEAELGNVDRHDAVEHELRLVGELLAQASATFECIPYDASTQCDSLIRAGGTEIECEITAWTSPAAQVAIERVCRRVEDHLRDRFSGNCYRVEIDNMWWEFPSDAGGRIDQEALFAACVADLGIAITPDGTPQAEWPTEHRGPVSRVVISGYMQCSQTGYSVGGVIPFEQLRRKVLGKVDAGQSSGTRPWMLAVVLQVWPHPEQVDRGRDPSIAEEAFNRDPALCCIAEVSGVVGAQCRLIWPETPRGLGLLSAETRGHLAAGWEFAYEHVLA